MALSSSVSRLWRGVAIIALMSLAIPEALAPVDTEDWKSMRAKMVKAIQADMRHMRREIGRSTLSQPVLDAMNTVPRHLFVPASHKDHAYDNTPLPIGEGQTISQPFIVALMTELLSVDAKSRVLEVGTGSGYQAAVLAEIVAEVYSIEIVPSLAQEAGARLSEAGYHNVHVRQGDGTLGWPSKAPFDGIIVTAAGIDIPEALLSQLKPGAHLVMPVGGENETQQLMVITHNPDGTYSRRSIIPVRFVPITH